MFRRVRQACPKVIVAVLVASILVQGYPIDVLAAPGVPQIFSYQGRLTDASGNLLGGTGTNYFFKFSIWDSPTVGSGNRIWPVTTPGTTTAVVRQGVFHVNIGDIANGYPDVLDHDFGKNDTIYLQVEVSSDNNSSETLTPRQQITAAAFAEIARSVRGTDSSTFGTTTAIDNSVVTVQSTSTTAVGLTLRGALGQAANLFQVQDSSANHYFSIKNNGGVFASSTLQVTGDVRFYGNLTLGSLNGPLQAINGVVSATTSIGVNYGGTGLTTAPTLGQMLVGNSSGGYSLQATSTLGVNLADTTGNLGVTRGGTGLTSAPNFGQLLVGNASNGYSLLATSTLAIALGDTTGTLAATRGGTGLTTYAVGDILYADSVTTLARLPRGSNGTVLKISGGLPSWGADLTSGGGGGAGAWATSSDSLAIYPSDTGYVVLVGTSATTTTGNIFEVVGDSRFNGNIFSTGLGTFANLLTTGSSTLQNFTAVNSTTTNATSTTFRTGTLGVANDYITDITGSGLTIASGALTLDRSGDWTGTFDGQEGSYYLANSFSTTSANVWLTTKSTTDLSEGTRLYYTDVRVNDYIHASTTIPKVYTSNTFTNSMYFQDHWQQMAD
jgi:hypothetical protein